MGTLLINETELAHNIKESIAILVSLENGCSICVGGHQRIAKILGVDEEQMREALNGVESMNIPE
jgi:AhpD family alkylhydroperoxidase